MSHVSCIKCHSNEHYQGYGFAAGFGLGAYTLCECGAVLEFYPDQENIPEPEE